jgi:ABC-type nitrate/sulfonate/bicarbonate transport system ATPase subunit
MPAEGGIVSTTEAPAGTPLQAEDPAGVTVDAARVTRGATLALDGVTLAAAPGEVLAVVGPSGCGKSTLLELACGLLAPDAGTVRAPPAALMPQRDLLLPWLDVAGNAALALTLQGVARGPARAAAAEGLARLGLAGWERARPEELSGGMRQRVAVVRTLLAGRPLLCLDEPFAALDALTRAELQEWLAGVLADERRTVLLVTHDVEEALVLADRVVVLSPRPGRVVAEVAVPAPRPRERTAPGLVALRARVLEALAAGHVPAAAERR